MMRLVFGVLLLFFAATSAYADEGTHNTDAGLDQVGEPLEAALDALVAKGAEALPLLERALMHSSPTVRENAAVAAGRMGKVAWPLLGLLDEALSDDHASVRTASARALGRIVQDRHPSGGDPIEEVARVNWIVQRLLKLAGQKPEWGRDGALQGLALMGWPAAMTLDNFLDEREMRQATFDAVLALGLDGQATVERWLRHPKWRVRAWAATAVGVRKDTKLDVGTLLGGVLADEASAVVVAAARALEFRARTGDTSVLVAMAEGLASPHAEAHAWLATGLQGAKTLPKAAVAPILRHLASIGPDPLSLLCAALGKATVHKDEVVSALLPQLKSSAVEVRYGAAAGLADLGKAPDAALPPLIDAVRRGGGLVRGYEYAYVGRDGIGYGVRRFGALSPKDATAALRLHGARGARALQGALLAAKDDSERIRLVDALAALRHHAGSELEHLVGHRNPDIARRAAVALAWAPEPSAVCVPILLACLEQRDDDALIEEPVESDEIDWHQTALEALGAAGVKLLPVVLEELVASDAADRARLQGALADYIVELARPAKAHLEALRVHPELGAYADELAGRIEAEARKAADAKKAKADKDAEKK
jgi:hypothetical protein